MSLTGPDVLARVRFCIPPTRLASGRGSLANLAIRGGELCLAGTVDAVGDIGGMRMHRNLLAGFAVEIEYADPVVL